MKSDLVAAVPPENLPRRVIDDPSRRRHLDLPKVLPVRHRILLHLRELNKRRDAGGAGS